MNKYIILIISLCFSFSLLQAQNHVTNPSFEEHTACPKGRGEIRKVIGWGNGGRTPDYYHACSNTSSYSIKDRNNAIMGVPVNMNGFQEARTGNAYVGIIGWHQAEIIQNNLKYTLKAGQRYYAEMFVNASNTANSAFDAIGMCFRTKDIRKDIRDIRSEAGKHYDFSFCKPAIVSPPNEFLSDTMAWTKVSGEFVAKGGEQYLVIGFFTPKEQQRYRVKRDFLLNKKGKIKFKYRKWGYKYAYYYIEDVKVVPVDSAGNEINLFAEKTDTITKTRLTAELNTPVCLKNIYFETDKAVLLPDSYNELDTLYSILKSDTTLYIKLAGHTDNTGEREYNVNLSQKRAEAVAEYLQNKGIKPERIETKGYGSTKPITENSTEEGRMRNRRVEFILFKKKKKEKD